MFRRIMALLAAVWLTSCASAEDRVVVTIGGDCVLGTREEWKSQDDTFDTVVAREGLAYPFGGIEAIFGMDDLSVINLECVLASTGRGQNYHKQHTFRGDPAYAQMLPSSGIEAVCLANNHTIDFGSAGKRSTRQALDDAGVPYFGYGDTWIAEVKGHKIGFAGCRETVWKKSAATVYREITALRKECEVVVYLCHWGKEYSPTHNATQERMARYAVSSGADIVVGMHPHVPQGVTVMDGVPVLWSLGNLVFGGTHDLQSFDGLLAQITLIFSDTAYTGCEITLYPVLTSGSRPQNDFRPILAPASDRDRILALVQSDSTVTLCDHMAFPREKGRFGLRSTRAFSPGPDQGRGPWMALKGLRPLRIPF